jgi:regulatory protein
VLEELIRGGDLSDERFSEAYVRTRVHRGYGPKRIGHELRERGIDATLVDMQLRKYDYQWWTLAEQARRKRFGDKPTDASTRARQARYLQYRGFALDDIRRLLNGPEKPSIGGARYSHDEQ